MIKCLLHLKFPNTLRLNWRLYIYVTSLLYVSKQYNKIMRNQQYKIANSPLSVCLWFCWFVFNLFPFRVLCLLIVMQMILPMCQSKAKFIAERECYGYFAYWIHSNCQNGWHLRASAVIEKLQQMVDTCVSMHWCRNGKCLNWNWKRSVAITVWRCIQLFTSHRLISV